MDPVDRVRELLNIGAGHAAGAFAGLVGKTFWMRVPRVLPLEADLSADGEVPLDAEATGILFEVEGAASGVVALLLPGETRDALAAQLLGAGDTPSPELVESAIRELGNIVVSHVCSAIADTLGARLLPSVPVLAFRGGAGAFQSLVAYRGSSWLRVETEIVDGEGDLRGLLVFVPDR